MEVEPVYGRNTFSLMDNLTLCVYIKLQVMSVVGCLL